jgi:hypothetical protein
MPLSASRLFEKAQHCMFRRSEDAMPMTTKLVNATCCPSLFLIMLVAGSASLLVFCASRVSNSICIMGLLRETWIETSGTILEEHDETLTIEVFLTLNVLASGSALLLAASIRGALYAASRCKRGGATYGEDEKSPPMPDATPAAATPSGRGAVRSSRVLTALAELNAEERIVGSCVQAAVNFQTLDEF